MDLILPCNDTSHLPLRFKDEKKKTILHYSHRHELSFFKYRKVCSDKIPKTLSHYFHPKHPLRLTCNFAFHSDKCNMLVQTGVVLVSLCMYARCATSALILTALNSRLP
ncbi:hypothetical protein Gotur_027344 [Gossypium turneri]